MIKWFFFTVIIFLVLYMIENKDITFILRHRKENLKKCSLRGLEKKENFCFLTYPKVTYVDHPNLIVLSHNAKPLSKEDKGSLLLLDGTWKHAESMQKQLVVPSSACFRSIPDSFRTAYPRRQEEWIDPSIGLASIEALYLALYIMGKNVEHLLENYHWKESFLAKNREALANYTKNIWENIS